MYFRESGPWQDTALSRQTEPGSEQVGNIVPALNDSAGIDATTKEDLHALACELSKTHTKRVGTLPVVIAPRFSVGTPVGNPLGRCLSLWATGNIVGTSQFTTRLTIDNREIFRTAIFVGEVPV